MTTPPAIDISVVVPAYNEAESVPVLAAEIEAALDACGRTWECVWVDDGSSDGTFAAIEALHARRAGHTGIRLEPNAGQSAALLAGFARATGTLVATLDADLQNDPADIPRLADALDRLGVDLVNGVRATRHDGWVRRVSSRIANGFRNRVTRVHVTDVGCSLRVMRRECTRGLPEFHGMHRFLPTFVAMNGFSMAELPVTHRPRRYGEPAYGIHNRLWVGLADTLGVRWLQSRHVRGHVARTTQEIRKKDDI